MYGQIEGTRPKTRPQEKCIDKKLKKPARRRNKYQSRKTDLFETDKARHWACQSESILFRPVA